MKNTKLEKNWLLLAISALGLSGLFTILLIVARTTKAEYFLVRDMFTTSLIVHVSLGILVWFFAMIMAYFSRRNNNNSKVAFYLALLGTILITISPFFGFGNAYQNNYIPIYDNSFFKAGIALFLAAIFFGSSKFISNKTEELSVIALIFTAFISFTASYIAIADKTSSHYLYETMFWGGGHILQFVYTQIMLLAWLEITNTNFKYKRQVLLFPAVFAAISTIFIYAATKVETAEHINYFTYQMIIGAGIAPVIIGFAILRNLKPFQNPAMLATLFSLVIFMAGGLLGNVAHARLMQGDITTLIPAHYHGSVIAVTIGLMGYCYYWLGINSKAAKWQVYLYSIGQIIYFAGLAILGQHGAPRKTPGIEGIDVHQMVYHFMHLGGTLTLIGGIMFVVIILRNKNVKI